MVCIGESYVECLLRKPMFTLIQAGVPCKWANDTQRLLLEWFDEIHKSPSQLYHLALPFCPPSSWLHKCYTTELSQGVKVIKGLPADWGMCFRTVTLDNPIWALTCWTDIIAIGLETGGIITLDGSTGGQIAVFPGHPRWVRSLAFSPDGTSLVSGSHDNTVKLWDIQTGGVVKTFYGHTHWVVSVSVSADCSIIASGSWDETIRLWDIKTGECCQVIKQQDWVYYVKFSPTNPQHLVSVSSDKVWHWDINGHQTKPAHNGSQIAFSLDGTKFVSCQGEDIVVQNTDSGAIVAKFHIANNRTSHCCFSPDGRLIAAAAPAEKTAYVWDITSPNPHHIKTLVQHTWGIAFLAFSSPSSLVSSSDDQLVKF